MGDFESPHLRFGVFQNYCTWYLSFYFTFKFIEIVDILLFVDSSMPVIIFVESTNLYFDLFHFLYNAIKKKFNVFFLETFLFYNKILKFNIYLKI